MTDAPGEGRITPTFSPAQVGKPAPCQHGCPNSGDIRSWIGAIAQHQREIVLGHRQVGLHGLAIPLDGTRRITLDDEPALIHHGDVERCSL